MKKIYHYKKFHEEWSKQIGELRKQGLERTLQIAQGLDFSSNDFLSLSHHSLIRQKLIKALKGGMPLNAGASRLIRGQTKWHEQTEFLFQKWVKRSSALFFSSGYLANMAIISTLGKDSVIFSDELNHASLIDGCRMLNKKKYIYSHKNLDVLENFLKKEKKEKKKIIITESLFSMDGDLAPLKELSALALRYGALLVVDEAHSTGLYGNQGAGLCTLLKQKEHIISVHPCGKAMGASGAFIAGSKILKSVLINCCRPFIYSTAPHPFLLFHIQCVIKLLQKNSTRRMVLQKKAKYFRDQLKTFASVGDSESAIVPLILGSNTAALKFAKFLQNKGYDIKALRYPTVAKGQERLRICIHYNHTKKQLDDLIKNLRTYIKKVTI